MIELTAAVKAGFRNYAAFGGRATRAEYWWWMLFTVAVAGFPVLIVIGGAIANATGLAALAYLSLLFALATLLPTLAITSRRLHDIGKSGWWQLAWYIIHALPAVIAADYPLLPPAVTLCVGIWAIIWLAKPGQPGANDFGPDPGGVNAAAATFPQRNDRAADSNR